MKLFRTEKSPNGRCHVYFSNIKIASYKSKKIEKSNVFVQGLNNTITNSHKNKRCRCYVYGNNNKIILGDNLDWSGDIYIGLPEVPVDNCSVVIGDNSFSNGTNIRICEDNTTVEIGKDCLFSSGITIWASDTHTVTDIDGNITNIGKYVKIGNHVWVGMFAAILKNTTIPDNCIVGTHCVVGGTYKKTNCVIAGNPGKIVKENINWDKRQPKQYIIDTKK